MTTDAITPYTAQIPDADLEDLRTRLGRVRWPDEVADAGWDYGVPLAYVRELAARLHVRSPEADALPLIITDGWPISVFEYLDLIGPLSDPCAHGADSATLSISSCLGSRDRLLRRHPCARMGHGPDRASMGGADGAARLSELRRPWQRPRLAGLTRGRPPRYRAGGRGARHQCFSFPSGDPAEFADLTEEDQRALGFLQQFSAGGGLAYNEYQSAQPQTLAYSLQDSPVGWLAWVLQLFRDSVDPDAILTDASVYWLTNTVGSSIRHYYEDAHTTERAAVFGTRRHEGGR